MKRLAMPSTPGSPSCPNPQDHSLRIVGYGETATDVASAACRMGGEQASRLGANEQIDAGLGINRWPERLRVDDGVPCRLSSVKHCGTNPLRSSEMEARLGVSVMSAIWWMA